MRLIAGDAYGLRNEVKTNSPLFYLHVILKAGARFGLPKEHTERGFYITKGSVEVAGNFYHAGQMLVFTTGADPVIMAKEDTTLMLLGGEPLGERFIWWNFVSSRKERIEQAKEDWKQGRIILPPNDNKEFIPLPEDKSRPAGERRGRSRFLNRFVKGNCGTQNGNFNNENDIEECAVSFHELHTLNDVHLLFFCSSNLINPLSMVRVSQFL